MSKNNRAVYNSSMTASAGQSSNDGWVEVFKQLGMLPVYAQPVYQPNSLEEGLAALNQEGTYNGPLTEIVSRVPLGSLPQWSPEMAENARQKVAWVYADAQAKGIQVPKIEPPNYDPRLPMGAHPVDIERYVRWEKMVDMQNKFPTYDARLLPIPNNGEVPTVERNRSMFDKLVDFGQNVKERINMDMNNTQNFNQPANGQQFAQPAQPVQPPQFAQQPIQPQAPVQQMQQMAQQVAAQTGAAQDSTCAKVKLWMYEHPKTTLVGAGLAGAGIFALGSWGYGKVFGGDPEFSEDDAAAITEIGDALGLNG